MKRATISSSLVLGLAVLLTSAAYAESKGHLQLSHPVTANGTTIKAGDYTVAWEGTGPDVEITFFQGKKVVAKVPAHLVDLGKISERNAAVVQNNEDGTSSLSSIRFEGKKFELELGTAANGMQAGSSK